MVVWKKEQKKRKKHISIFHKIRGYFLTPSYFFVKKFAD